MMYSLFSTFLHIYTIRDVIEIACISFFIYCFIRWLWKDTTYQPLKIFYGYSAGFFLAWFLQLPLLLVILGIGFPLIGLTLLLIHQETLQKNFITYKTQDSVSDVEYSWLKELMKAALAGANKQRELVGLIQKNDDLKGFVDAPYFMHADVEHHILTLLLEHGVSENRFVWLSQTGKIIAINAELRLTPEQQWISTDVASLPLWKQDALFITSKTDALVFHINKHTHLFECIINGKIRNDVTAHHLLLIIKRHLAHTQGVSYENFHFSSPHEQSPSS